MEKRSFPLSETGIDETSEAIQTYLEKNGLSRKVARKYTLSMESQLLNLLHRERRPEELTLMTGGHLKQLSVVVQYRGDAMNPLNDEGDESDLSALFQRNLGIIPIWKWKANINTLTLAPEKTQKPINVLPFAIAVLLAVLFGLLRKVAPGSVYDEIDTLLLVPVYSTVAQLISLLAGAVVFTGISTGIFKCGNADSFKQIGRKLFPPLLLLPFVWALLSSLVGSLCLRLNWNINETQGKEMAAVLSMVTSILPENLVTPFMTGNTMQIIVLGAITGVILLILGDRAGTIRSLLEESVMLLRMLMRYVCKLMPILIFASLLHQFWDNGMNQLLQVGRPLGLMTAICLVECLLQVLWTAKKSGKSPVWLIKTLLPVSIIGFSTASSMAAYSKGEEIDKKEFKIRPSLVDFGLPVCISTYDLHSAINFMLMVIFLAETYSVPVNITWMLIATFSCGLLAIAMPPIPGAGLMVYSILMLQLGIPEEGVAIAIVSDMIADYITTGFKATDIHLQLYRVSLSLRMSGSVNGDGSV